MKLLLIEDELELQNSTANYLENEGFHVETVSDYHTAWMKVNNYDYDCVIVDLKLPGGCGLDLVAELKSKKPWTGIIIASGRVSLEDRLSGLEIGADDYMTKPYHLPELNARLRSVIRRREFKGGDELNINDIKIIFDSRKVIVCGKEIILTRKEYDLLVYMATNSNRVLTREMIAEYLWGDHISVAADTLDFIYTHIKNVRKKLMESGAEDCIKTIYGVGYKFAG